MRKELIQLKLEALGARNIRIEEAHTLNQAEDPEGHRLLPTFYPDIIEAEGVTQEQINQVIAEVAADDQAELDKQEDQFAEKILKALKRLKDKGKLDKVLKARG